MASVAASMSATVAAPRPAPRAVRCSAVAGNAAAPTRSSRLAPRSTRGGNGMNAMGGLSLSNRSASSAAASARNIAAAAAATGTTTDAGGIPAWHPEADTESEDPDVPTPGFASIEEALAEVAAGRFVAGGLLRTSTPNRR